MLSARRETDQHQRVAHHLALQFLRAIPVLPSHRTSRTPRFGESNSSILVGYYRFTTKDKPCHYLSLFGPNELTLSLVPLSVVYWERCFDSLPLTTVVVRLFILSPTIRVLKGFINQSIRNIPKISCNFCCISSSYLIS